MNDQFNVFLQSITPQHLISRLAGWLANCETPWLKNRLIHSFMKHYPIDLSEAEIEQPEAFKTFNEFFTRTLKPGARVITREPNAIACPVDGDVAQIGYLKQNLLLQAKEQYFTLESLLGGDNQLAEAFYDGAYATLYLAPHHYHRVHMPFNGRLVKTLFIPGRLFSVNQMTANLVPNLYARNERLVTVFETTIGPMAVIFIGAMIVGSIQPIWLPNPIKSRRPLVSTPSRALALVMGDELGQFKLGSTVICLFGPNAIKWCETLMPQQSIQVGQLIGSICTN